ncbi:MAG: N-acetylmuramoyl-L-alanine amidase [Candidatus Eremiobacteraeota bacterium]|nr:N-acetylmuramoyl-L-alanine amidase [Candidatus Eremiobacteraeota bacterium]
MCGAFGVALLLLCASNAARASAPPASYWFGHQRLTFTRVIPQKNDAAVALHDAALQALLSKLGVAVAWNPGERYVLMTTPEPRIISFSVGDTRYDLEDVSAQAPFAPFVRDNDVYLPMQTLLRALYLEPKNDRGQMVLQPQLAVADIQSTRDGSLLVMHAALPPQAKRVSSPAGRLVYDFTGLGSTLQRVRKIRGSAISELDVQMGGTTRDPDTRVTVVLAPHAHADDGKTGQHLDFSLTLHGGPPSLRYPAPPSPPPPIKSNTPAPEASPNEESPEPSAPPIASVTDVNAQSGDNEFNVQITVEGNAAYEWHRLLDDRWYVDIHPAQLRTSTRDETPSSPQVASFRVHQLSNQTVRVALTLTAQKEVEVVPSQNGLTVSVKDTSADIATRTGSGTIGEAAAAAPSAAPSSWKYTPSSGSSYVPTNPRLIVIDPGHGGSDTGAQNSGLLEKTITFDISSRLRSILSARGWEVRLTRNGDSDVYGAGASDRDELQARVDVANTHGARLFVSIHVNSFGSSGPNGTTTYYYKPSDLAFANAIHGRLLAADLGTKDDGVIKESLYVVHHTAMPAVLVETAFLSNPDDRALLRSPEWLQKVARAIADGISDYAGSPRKTTSSLQR